MLESTRELSALVTARSRGAATGISGAGNTGAGNEGGGREATRSSHNCFNTSLVTMATIEAVEAASVGGRSSGRPAEAIRRRRTGGAGKSGSFGRVRAARRADGGRTAGAPRFAGRPAGMLQN
ncbi:hypothetical protein NP493_607g00016 [Ridgeia piscesae]|uniref:Uncharacterized protein n=1 Tax=Ridgeia piscesae TaxID=27915 RepID=A0AAD9KTD6_RIDPI|nr:hypothetical protein NP493_607g00016 [Ridgeia piscesae]